MAILIDHNSNIIVQGACTRRGGLILEDMLDYNANVCAGVCYLERKISQVRGVSLYRHLADAVNDMPEINVSVIASHAYSVLQNALEAMEAGIKLLIINSQFVPLRDVALIAQEARKHNATVFGPDSAGIITPDQSMTGSMGGIHALSIFRRGSTGVISRSNGLLNELSLVLKKNNLGISTAVALGTEKILMTDFVATFERFNNDKNTDVVVMLASPGGAFEEDFAAYYKELKNPKPVIAFIPGRFIDRLKEGVSFGHISSMVYRNSGSPGHKAQVMKNAGITVVDFIQQIPQLIKTL